MVGHHNLTKSSPQLSPAKSPLWKTATSTHPILLGLTHANGWDHDGHPSKWEAYMKNVFPPKLRILQWSRHLFNCKKNKKTLWIIHIFIK